MATKIKKAFYEILTQDLQFNVMDNPYNTKERKFPYVLLTLANINRVTYKNCFQYEYRFKVDIFSNYSGEKEILEMETAIFDKLGKLYDIPEVTYIREPSCKIMDDKTTGPVRKHGVITYVITCLGQEEEINEDNQTS